jgi:predicted HAD superfamily phosphohydrolase YqeG
MQDGYRQFGLLNDSQMIYNRTEYGNTQVNEKKEHLMKSKKLVLVLDLDNTLIHSTEYRMHREYLKHKKYRHPGI